MNPTGIRQSWKIVIGRSGIGLSKTISVSLIREGITVALWAWDSVAVHSRGLTHDWQHYLFIITTRSDLTCCSAVWDRENASLKTSWSIFFTNSCDMDKLLYPCFSVGRNCSSMLWIQRQFSQAAVDIRRWITVDLFKRMWLFIHAIN